jgi:16S rRNA processing protein RimM
MEPEPTVVVGRIAKPHGVAGEVAVEVRSDNPDRFAPGATLYLEDGRSLEIRTSRPHAGALLVSFAGVGDRDAAEALRGATLVIPRSMLPDLPEGAWWPHQLVGCEVLTESGRSLGTLADVIHNPANDLWLVRDERGAEILVPALRDVLVDVDTAARRVVVRDVPGLTAPDDPVPA